MDCASAVSLFSLLESCHSCIYYCRVFLFVQSIFATCWTSELQLLFFISLDAYSLAIWDAMNSACIVLPEATGSGVLWTLYLFWRIQQLIELGMWLAFWESIVLDLYLSNVWSHHLDVAKKKMLAVVSFSTALCRLHVARSCCVVIFLFLTYEWCVSDRLLYLCGPNVLTEHVSRLRDSMAVWTTRYSCCMCTLLP